MDQPLFGEVLRTLMRQTPVRALARAIHVEQSVVYRWLRNERVPQLNTDHVANIAQYLQLDPRATERLKQAQITSLTQIHTGQALHSRMPRPAHAATNRFFEQTQRRSGSLPARHVSTTPRIRTHPPASTTLRGVPSIVQAAVEIIEHAQPDPLREQTTILLSLQGEELFAGLAATSGAAHVWHQALRGALRRGWQIEQLWRLDKDVGRSLHLVESMLDLVGLGGYHPRYFDHYGLLRPPYELVIVPGSAAILLLAANNATYADGALVLTEPAQIALMSAHYAQIRDLTRPLLQGFLPVAQELEVTRAVVSAEAKPGGRLVVKDGLSGLTHPPSWLREDSLLGQSARRTGIVSVSDLPAYMRELRRRLAQFETHVQRYDYLDVCPQRAIRQLADTGQYHPDTPLYGQQVPLKLRLEHIQHLVFLLQSYERYHLALIDEYEEQRISLEPTRLIAGSSDAFVAATARDASDTPVMMQVHITEPTIVAAFREHFADMWERVAPPHRQKPDVVLWLKRQAELLEQRIRAEADTR